MQNFNYTMKTENGKPAIEQQQVGHMILSYNPDDEKFYLSDVDHNVYMTGKSWRNIVARANRTDYNV